MKLKRDYITPFISLTFFVVGISGILMFFHLFDGYTEVVHECLGMFFFVCAIFHVILNWKGLKMHFKRGVFIPAALGILVISVTFMVFQQLYPPADFVLFNQIIKAPLYDAFTALGVDYPEASKRLEDNGISIHQARSIEDIWIRNNADPEKVIDLIME